MKIVDGMVDGWGNVIGDVMCDYWNSKGYVLDGVEYLMVFDGLMGEVLDIVNYIFEWGKVSVWGDVYGNCVDCFLVGVVYFDGVIFSMIFMRGYYICVVIVVFYWIGISIFM